MHICLVTSRLPPSHCGVGDYTARLARELHSLGLQITIITSSDQVAKLDDSQIEVRNVVPSWNLRGVKALIREVRRLTPDATIIQWVPFLYGNRGINLALPFAALWLRFRGIRIDLMVHELWVPLDRLAFYISGPIQRVSLWLLICASRQVGVSIQCWTKLLQRFFPWKRRDISWRPVGSNIPQSPLSPASRKALRHQWKVSETSCVIAVFSPLASGVDRRLLEAVWRKVKEEEPESYLAIIGVPAQKLQSLLPSLFGDPRCLSLGYLSPDAVSASLQTVDILFAPFTDGISTRRTSAISAMAHSIPIVTTRGMLTDIELFEHSPVLLRELDITALSETLIQLCRDSAQRSRIGKATFQFFLEHFSWQKIAARILSTLPLVEPRDSKMKQRVAKC